MPRTKVLVFKPGKERPPLLEWLQALKGPEPTAYSKCLAVIKLLGLYGSELRRPTADLLRDDIRELRTRVKKVRLRVLYFYCGKDVACLFHAFVKKQANVPDVEIDRAVA